MTDTTRNSPDDATLNSAARDDDARLRELDRLVMDGFSEQLLSCFNKCVGDECVIACELPRYHTEGLSENAGGIITLGISTPALVEAGARRDDVLAAETIAELVSDLRDRTPGTRFFVIRAATGAVSVRLLVKNGASA